MCSQPECQRHRRADYHRRKIQADPVYAQVVLDSRKQWRAEHADYQKPQRAFVRMEPKPGERFEVDWGHFESLDYQGDQRKLYAFALVDGRTAACSIWSSRTVRVSRPLFVVTFTRFRC